MHALQRRDSPECIRLKTLRLLAHRESAARMVAAPRFRELQRATELPITAAGGITSMNEVGSLEKAGMHAAVGMAIYTGKLAAKQTGFRRKN